MQLRQPLRQRRVHRGSVLDGDGRVGVLRRLVGGFRRLRCGPGFGLGRMRHAAGLAQARCAALVGTRRRRRLGGVIAFDRVGGIMVGRGVVRLHGFAFAARVRHQLREASAWHARGAGGLGGLRQGGGLRHEGRLDLHGARSQ
jgi:hypothetical protein